MGKIVKFCSKCDESFAERFGFCPTCGSTLEAYDMQPVVAQPVAEPTQAVGSETVEPEAVETLPPVKAAEPEVEAPIVEEIAADASTDVVEPAPIVEAPAPVEPKAAIVNEQPIYVSKAKDADSSGLAVKPILPSKVDDDFRVTVIEQKDGGKRGMLMLGSLFLVLTTILTATVVSIFSKDLEIGSINDDIFSAVLTDDVPTKVEDEKPEVKPTKKDAGGGGGGGKNEPDPVSQGQRAPMLKNPQVPPSAHMDRVTNPAMRLQVGIQGPVNETTVDPNQKYGMPNSTFQGASDGPGSGGGMGSGIGRGQGNGNGTGFGNGNGSGMGNGNGNGIGDGTGNGVSGAPPPVKPKPAGVTTALRVISKPKPGYTDAARVANTQGVVVLRVTFRADGSIGDVSTVKGLPNGLTEQAIAAARRIAFEPKKVDGVGQSVTRNVEFAFNIF